MDLSFLNDQQRAAVRHTEGALLLLAGAGSGKTRVITCRIAYLLKEKRVPAEQIVAATFTNKAAREMKERVVAQVGAGACRGMIISTFHSLGLRLLRDDIGKLGYKSNFSIYGGSDQIRLVRDLLQEVGIKMDAEAVLGRISGAKNRLLPPGAKAPSSEDPVDLAAAGIYPRYQRALKAFNALDFDDILMLTVRLLEEHPPVLRKIRKRFRYLMVDEYQDTNLAQYRLLHLLCAEHGNLCVVGDDDQSIYGWRGAEPENILDFEKDYPGAQIIKLEENYRSSGRILKVANALIRHNAKRREKVLWTSGPEGPPVDYISCEDGEDEARMVVERIHAERFRQKMEYRDFAVLYRTNIQSRAFEEQLRYENIPYVLIGGQQFFDRKEVKDVLAYFKVLVNPLDEVNLLRILNWPRRGIGETSADRLIRASADREVPLWDVLSDPFGIPDLGEKTVQALQQFTGILENYRRRFRQPGFLAETGRRFIKDLGIEDELYRTAEDPARGRRRAENVEEVLNALATYEEREPLPTLAGFLEKVSLLDRDEPVRSSKETKLAKDAVVLMSLHSSKGLEFPCVFLVGMEEDFLPHRKSAGEFFDVDEERRLCYVGITRARRKLIFLNAARRRKFGKLRTREPSRFLGEIPPELLEKGPDGGKSELSPGEQEKTAASFFAGIKALLED